MLQFFFKFTTFGLFFINLTSSLPLSDEEINPVETLTIEKMFGEVQELKRVARQCPFSAIAGTFLGGGGAGGNGQPPDLTQMVQIARRLLDTFDGANGVGAGGVGGSDIDTNVLARMRNRRRF